MGHYTLKLAGLGRLEVRVCRFRYFSKSTACCSVEPIDPMGRKLTLASCQLKRLNLASGA